MCNDECCDRGLWHEQTCFCDIGYFGEQCQFSLKDQHIAPYYTFIGLFSMLFFGLMLFSIRQLHKSLLTNKIPSYYKGCSYLYNMFASPQNYILSLTILFCALRLIWLILDPLQPYDYQERVYERLLAEIVYTILFIIYGSLLIVWYTMYDEVSYNVVDDSQKQNRKWIYRYYKDVMKARLVLVFAIQITVSTLNGLRLSQKYPNYLFLFYGLLLLNFVLFIIEFFIYGGSLRNCIRIQLKKYAAEQGKKQLTLVVGSQVNNPSIIKSPNDVSPSPINSIQSKRIGIQQEDQIQELIQSPPQLKVIEQIEMKRQSFTKKNSGFGKTFAQRGAAPAVSFRQDSEKVINSQATFIISEESQHSIEQQGEIKNTSMLLVEGDAEKIEWNVVPDNDLQAKRKEDYTKLIKQTKSAIQQIQRKKEKTNIQKGRNAAKHQNMLNTLHNQEVQSQGGEIISQLKSAKQDTLNLDKRVLSKIQLLVQIGVFLEICFGVLSVLLLTTNILTTSVGTLIFLYISSMLQFLSLFTVIKLFKDVKSQEQMNLVWIQKVGSKKNKINQHYTFVIPQQSKLEDESKLKFENRININSYY